MSMLMKKDESVSASSVITYSTQALKPIRPRTLNEEMMWYGLIVCGFIPPVFSVVHLPEIIGGFGKFQKFVFVLSCYTILLSGFFMLIPVFLLGTPAHRCAIPVFDNDTYDIQSDAHQDMVDMYIPKSDKVEYKRCFVCETSTNTTVIERRNCTIDLAVQCERWVYDKSMFGETFVTQVNLVCDKAIWVANAEMVFYGGMVMGSLASGFVADAYGRKPVMYVSGLIMVATSISLTWVRTYWLFCVIEFILGGSVVAVFMAAYIISIEITNTKKRVWPGVVSNFPYVAGLLILAAVAYCVRDWDAIQLYLSIPGILLVSFWAGLLILAAVAYCVRDWDAIQLYLSIPGILLVSFWWLMPESPRWLLTKGRVNEAEAIIRQTARWNKTTVPDALFDRNPLEAVTDEESSFVKLFMSRKQWNQTLVIFFNWTVNSLAYFGLALNSNNLNGNLYLNFALSGLVEVPAYILVTGLVDKVGRRRLYCVTMIVGGLACVSTIVSIQFTTEGSDGLTTSLSMIGRLCVTAAAAVVYIHSAELFPTVVRNTGMCWASVFANIGSMIAPYILVWGESYDGEFRQALPLLICGVASILSGIVSLLLPETLNTHLPDLVQDEVKVNRSFGLIKLKNHQDIMNESQDVGHELLPTTD